MIISRTVDVEVKLTAEELAEQFWAMDGDNQARFFDALANTSSGRLPMQLQAVADSDHLTIPARVCMQSIGEYGE